MGLHLGVSPELRPIDVLFPLWESRVGRWAARPLPPGGAVRAFCVPAHCPVPSRAPGSLRTVSPHPPCDFVRPQACAVVSCSAGRGGGGACSVTAESPLGKRPRVVFICHSWEMPLLPPQLLRDLSLYHHLYLPRAYLAPPWVHCSREQGWASDSPLSP